MDDNDRPAPREGGDGNKWNRLVGFVKRFCDNVRQYCTTLFKRNAQNDPLVTVTYKLVGVTWALVGVGACTLVAALLQWRALESTDHNIAEQAKIMGKQLSKMETTIGLTQESNRINREAFTSVQRAFVVVTGYENIPTRDGDGKIIGRTIYPIIKNAGNTPATGVSIISIHPGIETPFFAWDLAWLRNRGEYVFKSGVIRAPRDPDEILTNPSVGGAFFQNHMRSLITSNTYIAPSSTFHPFIDNYIVTRASLEAMAKGNVSHFIYGSIRYKDIFGASHVSKYCATINNFTIGGDEMPLIVPIPCRHWNCVGDVDCSADKIAYEKEYLDAPANQMEMEKKEDELRRSLRTHSPPPQ